MNPHATLAHNAHTRRLYSPTVPTHYLQDEGPLVTAEQHISRQKSHANMAGLSVKNNCVNGPMHTSVLWW